MKVEKDMPLEETAEKKPPRRKKLLWIVGGVVGGLAVACAVICAVAAGGNRILNHTSVLGVDMSGLTREQAIARWQEQGGNACKVTVIPLTVDGEETAEVSLEELGVTVTPEEAADAAWNAGHGGNFLKKRLCPGAKLDGKNGGGACHGRCDGPTTAKERTDAEREAGYCGN